MQNKANFGNGIMNINTFITMGYKNLGTLVDQKTNPIQTQFKPNLTQNKPNLSQFKPNSNPIQTQFVEGPKMLEFTLDVSSLAFLSGAWIGILQ
jgi:hypothetical protein